MPDAAVIRANERCKAISGALFNLGTALTGATVVKLYATPAFDLALAIWSFGAGTLIWAGWMVLGLLESEG